jgi:hypothetical protein
VPEPPLGWAEDKAALQSCRAGEICSEKNRDDSGKNMSNFDQRGNSILEEIHKNNINVYYVGDASTNNFSVYSEERDL